MFTILLCYVAGHRAFDRGGRPRARTTASSRLACPRCGAPRHPGERGEHMDDERQEGLADAPAPAIPRDLAQLAPAVDVVDPITLAQNMATWHQMRAVLTAYISEHMQEGIDYYTLMIGGKVSKPSLSKAGSEKFLSLFNVHAKFRKDDETWEMLGRPA